MPNSAVGKYLAEFSRRGRETGLDLKRPGQNWVSARDLVPGSHVSLSVSRHKIEVNLNNEKDEDRRVFDLLYADRAAITDAVGCSLSWEKKEGRKETAVRASLEEGYDDDTSWDRQHEWAVGLMKRFEREFGRRLSGIRP